MVLHHYVETTERRREEAAAEAAWQAQRRAGRREEAARAAAWQAGLQAGRREEAPRQAKRRAELQALYAAQKGVSSPEEHKGQRLDTARGHLQSRCESGHPEDDIEPVPTKDEVVPQHAEGGAEIHQDGVANYDCVVEETASSTIVQPEHTETREWPKWPKSWFSRWKEPGLQPGMVRIKFKCACGTVVWDDYPESMSKAAKKLEQELNTYFRQLAPASNDGRGGTLGQFPSLAFSATASAIAHIWNVFASGKKPPRNKEADTEAQPRAHQQAPEASSFYLTCAPNGSRIPGLTQSPSAAVRNDLEYFDLLRKISSNHRRTWRGFLSPRKITSIEYVKFELLFDNEHAVIRQTPGYPEVKGHYLPCKADLEIESFGPWPPNTLLHYFERRHKCTEHPRILARIPKKLKQKLQLPDDDKTVTGWGMQLVDGVDGFRIGIQGSIGLILSSLVGVLWAKLHGNDVQGGTGLVQCMMAIVTFFVTMHGLVGFVEKK